MTDHWTDQIVGDRMTVDQQFADRVDASAFSRQQWGLVMTAVEFKIDQPTDPSSARLWADTTNLRSVLAELDAVEERQAAATPGGGEGGTAGGIVTDIKDALGLGGSSQDEVDEERLEAAERLTDAYAEELQHHLEDSDRWSDVCETAAESDD
jgi:hypothetical protein